MMIREENKVKLIGTISEPFELSHETYDMEVYSTILDVKRDSGVVDKVPIQVIATKHLANLFKVGTQIFIEGEVRTYNKENHLKIIIFANRITEVFGEKDINEIEMIGYLCKPPIYRVTPFGRKICDLLVAVPRFYTDRRKSAYVPCIVWGRNAEFAQNLQVGDKVELQGRMQSREYLKRINEEEVVTKTAREVSCGILTAL